jgi:hypothetical protein
VFFLTTTVFLGLAVVNLISTNALATEGIVVSEAETQTLKLEKENQIISVKIQEASQLNSIEDLAKKRGFARSNNIVFVPTPPTFASR